MTAAGSSLSCLFGMPEGPHPGPAGDCKSPLQFCDGIKFTL